MKRQILLTAIILGIATGAVAQRAFFRDNSILINGMPAAKITKEDCGGFYPGAQYYVKSLDGDCLFAVRQFTFKDPEEVSEADWEGKVNYVQIVFAENGAKAEMRFPGTMTLRPIDIARIATQAKLITDGQLDMIAVERFAAKNGTHFTERRRGLGEAVAAE